MARAAREERHRLVRVAHRALLVRARARSRRARPARSTPRPRCARAREAAPPAPRPWLLAGQRHAQRRAPRRSAGRLERAAHARSGGLPPGGAATTRRAAPSRPARPSGAGHAAGAVSARSPAVDLLQAHGAARKRRHDAAPAQCRGKRRAPAAASSRRIRPRRPRRRRCRCRSPTGPTPAATACATRSTRRRAAAALPLRRLRLRGAALFLAMPGLPRAGTPIRRSGWRTCERRPAVPKALARPWGDRRAAP